MIYGKEEEHFMVRGLEKRMEHTHRKKKQQQAQKNKVRLDILWSQGGGRNGGVWGDYEEEWAGAGVNVDKRKG